MFEGLVRQLILGYLGQYIKDIHQEQLKITLWNEEVLLENVELILEAFDYLQLPFALKQGRVGRLSIRIPWKKLGWDPIIIILEDVLVSACQRDDKEWDMDAVERREFAGKKAKLAAAELAKLSRRVCGNQTGKSFVSYMTAKILDGIQVSIRNVHIIYHNVLPDSVHSVFGLKFTSLTVMKQNIVGFSTAKGRGGQVNKLVEVQGLEICCRTFQGSHDSMTIDNVLDVENFEGSNDIYMLTPVDVSVSLLVNRSGKLENDAPQYSVNVELANLVLSLNEAQFHQILILYDYLSTCRLREKYGRYRPWWSPLSKKQKGWQTLWWQYAQQSVLSDVRKRLRKTSWKYLGERLNCRRRYMKLYMTKLECLRQEQLVDQDTLQKLEQMEKESDIDDILSYRSAAERELQEFFLNSTPGNSGVNGANIAGDKLPRGWLNWLSRGMLGAGGTDDSSQFSGVVSDEVIKDIYEATMFHPVPSSANGDTTSNDEIYLSSFKLNIQQISATLRSMKFGRAIGELSFEGIFFECKIWEESVVVNASVDSIQMLNPSNKQVILLTRRDIIEDNVTQEVKDPSLCIQVDVSPINHEVSLKVILKPLEVICYPDFLVNTTDFYNILKSFEFQHERVLKSLNGIDDTRSRFLSKAGYLVSNRKRVSLDLYIFNIIMVIPWESGTPERHKMIVESGTISFVSKSERDSLASDTDNQSYMLKNVFDPILAADGIMGFQVQDLYDLFEVKVTGFEVKISVHCNPQSTVSILEKSSATVTLVSCIVHDESVLRAMEVYISIPSLRVHFSPSIYASIMRLKAFLVDSTNNILGINGNGAPMSSTGFSLSVKVNLESANFFVDLENDVKGSIMLMLSLQGIDIRFCQVGLPECLIFTRVSRIMTCSEKSDGNIILYSSGNTLATNSERVGVENSNHSDDDTPADVSLFLQYKAYRKSASICHTCNVSLNDVDLHCHPYIFGLLVGFFDKLSGLDGTSHLADKVNSPKEPKNHHRPTMPYFQFQNFGFSNFIESGSFESESIPVDHFPFVTIYNTGFLTNVDTSFIYGGLGWREALNLRNRKIVRTKMSTKSEFEKLFTSSLDSRFGTVLNLNMSNVRVHFHDSSCIVGTITLPTSICSLSIHEDRMDILCSTEGLTLSSSWWTQIPENFMWGPSSTDLSPILNVRVRKKSLFEICFSIQHVTCTLPPEFLAIIIGYFSLPEWSFSGKDQNSNNSILFKFEILDAALFIPVESIYSQFLKLEIPQLYCSFILNGDQSIVLQDIPSDCLVPPHRLYDRNHCLNIFGHDLSLSLMLLMNQRKIPLIAPIYVDLWIRIPSGNDSSGANTVTHTCVMARVSNCEVVADGESVLVCQALLNIVDRFASVDTESKRFTADVAQFLELKTKGYSTPPDSPPTVAFTEFRCSVNSMSIKLYCSARESLASKFVAKADLVFVCSASLHNEKPLCVGFSLSSVSLYSLFNSVILVECTSPCYINFSVLSSGENEFCVSLSSIYIWLHLLDWSQIIDIINSHAAKQYNNNSVMDASSTSSFGLVDTLENKKSDDDFYSIVNLETTGITIHIPIHLTGEALQGKFQEHNMEMNNSTGCISLTLEIKNSKVVIFGRTLRLMLNLEKASGTVEMGKDKGLSSWPIFQLFQVATEAEICYDQHIKDVSVELKCDSFDLWLSHQIFYFWHCVSFNFPQPASQSTFGGTIDCKLQLRKLSLLLTDGKRSSNGPLLEVLARKLLLNCKVGANEMGGTVAGDLQVNYNNIHKVLWEPFVEPWNFFLSITRRQEKSGLLNSEIMTDINLSSTTQLNLNVTESFIEVAFRAIDMISWGLMGLNILSESPRFSKTQISENIYTGRYAPYILQNLTSLPLMFHVCEGLISDSAKSFELFDDETTLVEPGSSVPIYIDETPEEQLFRYRPSHSSDRLSDKQFMEAAHRYIVIQLEGTSMPSAPISMDLVGLSYFEVDFSLTSNNLEVDNNEDTSKGIKRFKGNARADVNSGYVVPVVLDVSVQKYTKLVRLYSTVILFNATSIPFEVRFDIPFGLAPKVLDPIYPGQEFPLPLHLAEAGRMRWRPLGNTYLWSEAYNVSSILSNDNRIGFVRSFVCYPSHPSSDPFRCSLSVHEMCLPSVGKLKKGASLPEDTISLNQNRKHSVHLVTLCSPLTVKSFLPVAISLTIECAGVTCTALLSEVETSFFHIDSSHDLAVTINMDGLKPCILKFPRAETFVEMAKFSGTKFSLSETISFESDSSGGPLYVTMEKVMDAFCGAREICIFVPYLLYNCTGFPLVVSSFDNETKEKGCIVPSCYDLDEQDLLLGSRRRDGLSVLSSSSTHKTQSNYDDNSVKKKHIISTRDNVDSHLQIFSSKPLNVSGFSSGNSNKINLKSTAPDFEAVDSKKVDACMYSPLPNNSSASEIMVRVSRCLVESCLWSSPFFLVPPTGSNSVLVPQPSSDNSNNAGAAAYILSVTSSTVAGQFSGKTRIITFQPRYVISNACSKDLCYKQKGTDVFFHLRTGQHSHIQWTDTTRELLVSIRFDEPGSQWSGCFLPEHLGDTQLKMRNYVTGILNMIRVEVQNADVSVRGEERIIGSSHGNSGTNLILLSDDDTGFMPYRIDNFSKERLRIYQQRCETFDTVIHSYTSCPYAWDEPCFAHRLAVEVPGERVVGAYSLDDVKEYAPVCLPVTSEKPERTLLVSVHAEGALKVLSVIDSSYHILNEKRGQQHFPLSKEKRQLDQRKETSVLYNETLLIDIPFIGISVMNSYPQELIFACANNVKIGLVRSLDHQKFSLQISSLQIDNQLHSTPYPVILSFDREHRINSSTGRTKDDNTIKMRTESSWEPVLSLSASKWSNKDVTLVSFEYIIIRVADFHLDLEQEVILSLSDFMKIVTSGFPQTDSTLQPLFSDFGFVKAPSKFQAHEFMQTNGGQIFSVSVPMFIDNHKSNQSLPSIIPIGAPWQKNYLLARKHKKIYVELFDLAPVKLTLSFSSSPWMLRNGVLTSGESLIHRGLMALADVEGAKIHLKQLVITHQLASWESLQDILTRHYSRQLLHEIYKVFGSAGVIGNPMGFARSLGLGIKDFLSVPARSVMKSPAGLITGMAQGTTSLVSNTVYAISDAATQFSRAAQKGIVALTFDDQAAANMEKLQKGASSHSKGVINEFLAGLTGLLQSPIKGAEKHGLPGVLSGVALGVTGLVARPAASILEVTGKTAQSIRNRSKLQHHQMGGSHRFRVRLPRPLSSEFPLRPYSWEEAVGASVLAQDQPNDDDDGDTSSPSKLKDEVLVMCKSLKQGGKFVIITERLVLVVSCPSLVDLGTPLFKGVPVDPEWVIETEIRMDSVIHADSDSEVVHIVGSSADALTRQSHHQKGRRGKRWSNSPATPLPLFQTNLEFKFKDEADNFLQVLLSTFKKGKDRGWGSLHLLHQINLK